MPLVKSVMFPTTPAENPWTPLTTEAAKSEPGRLGNPEPPGVGFIVGPEGFDGVDGLLYTGSYRGHQMGVIIGRF
jgi:hypothetical protein